MKLPGQIKNVELIEKRQVGSPDDAAYLSLHSLSVQNTYADGSKSRVYRYEGVLRKWLDAVVLILTAEVEGQVRVCLRTSIRPPLLLRQTVRLPLADDGPVFALLELPAGLIEDTDIGREGLLSRASAEALEETGYALPPERFSVLGSAPFVSAGVIPEKMFFVQAAVSNIDDRVFPEGDGSPAEEGADIVWVGLEAALKMCDNGTIVDMKTELGIRRLASRTAL